VSTPRSASCPGVRGFPDALSARPAGAGLRPRLAQRLPCSGRHLPGVFRVGSADGAHAGGFARNIPKAHVPHEWPDPGGEGPAVVPQRAPDRRPLGRLGEEVLPAAHGVLHLRPDPPHEDQSLVVLCGHLRVGRVRGDFLRDLRLRGRHHPGARAQHGVRPGLGHFRRQLGDQSGHRRVPWAGVRRQPGGGSGLGHRHAGHLLHLGGGARVAAGEDEAGVVGSSHLLGAGGPVCLAAEGGPGLHRAADLYNGVPLLPARGRPVLQLLPLPAAGRLAPAAAAFLSDFPQTMTAGAQSSYYRFDLFSFQIMGFSPESVAAFIAVLGLLSIVAQTVVLSLLMRSIGNKNTILLGLGFQILQLAWYGFGSEPWMMWAAGAVAAMSSITFPAVSALISRTADPDQQGVGQGMITGIRGLCNGLGPALYGFIFYIFHVELDEVPERGITTQHHLEIHQESAVIPGPPFLFGACSVLLALLVALFIPEHASPGGRKKHASPHGHPHGPQPAGDAKEPLLQDTNV
uniref:Major facilitator superfamily (MFS) profile domain-containing protein n=1 Tax=Denticeps clupeoides TaxID=299321 RepID=A0AAY4BFK7_9TELE